MNFFNSEEKFETEEFEWTLKYHQFAYGNLASTCARHWRVSDVFWPTRTLPNFQFTFSICNRHSKSRRLASSLIWWSFSLNEFERSRISDFKINFCVIFGDLLQSQVPTGFSADSKEKRNQIHRNLQKLSSFHNYRMFEFLKICSGKLCNGQSWGDLVTRKS